MPLQFEFELVKAAGILVRDLFKLQPGETFIITADTGSDQRVVDATASAAFACGAKPMVIWLASPLGVGKAADISLPQEALASALKAADAWAEFNEQWLLYSTPYDIALRENPRLRHLCMTGMSTSSMVRTIGRVDYPLLEQFMRNITELTRNARHVRMTTPSGGDVEFENEPGRKITMSLGYADTPGSHMLPGQIGWSPAMETINGIIVFEGSIVPPFGLLQEKVKLIIQNGEIVNFEGGNNAQEYEAWLKSFNHPQMLRLAHVCYGFLPAALLLGRPAEDERVWGCTEWGIGNVADFLIPGGISAPSHSDGICLNTSVWLDGIQIMDCGHSLDLELIELARKLGKW